MAPGVARRSDWPSLLTPECWHQNGRGIDLEKQLTLDVASLRGPVKVDPAQLLYSFTRALVEPGSCLQRLMGSVKTGVILKDVSLEVNGGEVLAILGSKGSGKRALLEVISRRAQGPTRGQIILNGAPMSLRLFQQSCGYVTHKCDLLPGLNVEQTLYYAAQLTIGSQVSRYMKRSRVKQVMADLALSQVANRSTDDITQMVLLLDEPTWDLDPLNTYLVISILSNHARKYGRAVVLTMEKPRSDVFPFLDRVTYLCLGDVVYTGATRLMLHYFRSIGFPCPELENPLMYYLCLSTVDRRSRERFIESNHQIAALVEKFKLEGGPFRKSSAVKHEGLMMDNPDNLDSGAASRVPLSAFGHPGSFNVAVSLYMSRYYQESQEGLYSGPLFLVTYYLYSLPFSIVSVAAGSRIVFQLTGLDTETEWLLFVAVLWSCHILAEQQTIALLMVIKSSFTAAVTSVYITIIYLVLGSGNLRAIHGLSEWLLYLTYATQTRYAGAFLNQQVFNNGLVSGLPYDATLNCSSVIQTQESLSASSTFICRYGDGLSYLKERYSREDDDTFTEILDNNLNIGATFAFSVGLLTLDCFLYLVPLPAFVKAKFRE
uniref:ABC transporter domain-containing protein n=1 Tax=Timema genevievae TaxID=629358 RepID=A0A7R9PL18_TIMGE|nr:unnamed protein product [Timema genevievae]